MNALFELYVPPVIERRLLKLRRSVREALALRLQEVLEAAQAKGDQARPEPVIPVPRVYAENYRVFYQVDPLSRCVVVLELRRSFV